MNHKRPIFAFIFFATLFALLPVLRAADDAPTLDADATKKDNITIRLPVGWLPAKDPPKHVLLIALVPQRDKDDVSDFQAQLAIVSAPGNKIDGIAQQARVAHEFPSYKILEKPTRLTIGGMDAISFGGTFSQGPVKLRTRQYLLVQNSHIYILTFTSLESRWLDYVALLEASVDTLTIDKK